MAIYTTNNHIPYTYLIGWTKLNIWYYGRRTKKGCHPSEFWITYFTSSNKVHNFKKEHGEPNVVKIRKTFTGTDKIHDCVNHEVTVLRRIDAVKKDMWLNKGNAGSQFDTSGKVIAKEIESGKIVVINQNDFAPGSSLVGINSGIKFRKCKCQWCEKEIAINNISTHELSCACNPAGVMHQRTGIPLPESIKENMRLNHADVSGACNPKAKLWILTSPIGDKTYINGTLNQTLREKQLSRNHLIANLGQIVQSNCSIRSELTRNTLGWKLESP